MDRLKSNDCIWKNSETWKAWYQKKRKNLAAYERETEQNIYLGGK